MDKRTGVHEQAGDLYALDDGMGARLPSKQYYFCVAVETKKDWPGVCKSIVHTVMLNLLFVVLLFRDDSLLSNYVLSVAMYREATTDVAACQYLQFYKGAQQ